MCYKNNHSAVNKIQKEFPIERIELRACRVARVTRARTNAQKGTCDKYNYYSFIPFLFNARKLLAYIFKFIFVNREQFSTHRQTLGKKNSFFVIAKRERHVRSLKN